MPGWRPRDFNAFQTVQQELATIIDRLSPQYPLSAAIVFQLTNELLQKNPNAKRVCLLKILLETLLDERSLDSDGVVACIENARSLPPEDVYGLIGMIDSIAQQFTHFARRVGNASNTHSLENNQAACENFLRPCREALLEKFQRILEAAVRCLETLHDDIVAATQDNDWADKQLDPCIQNLFLLADNLGQVVGKENVRNLEENQQSVMDNGEDAYTEEEEIISEEEEEERE